jgi:glutaconate CoA-transferase, subunit A
MGSSKLVTLSEAARLVPDGVCITVGGTLLHRTPAAFVRELARQGRRDLALVKPSPAYDLDLLCAAGCLSRSNTGIATFEAAFGMAVSFRRAVERGEVRHTENS